MLSKQENRLVYRFDAETLWIEPWGSNALRVRATKTHSMPSEDWALIEPLNPTAHIEILDTEASITNGNIKAVISKRGKLIISNSKGKVLLEEYTRNQRINSIQNAVQST